MMANAQKTVDYSSNPRMTGGLGGDGTPSAISSLSAWKEFQAGMQILHRYAGSSAADVHSIAKSNLQLLHRSLSFDSVYRNSIESTQREGAQSGLPTLRHLYSEQGLIADLLTLQDGASINLTTLPQRYTMYLLISGNAQLGTKSKNDSSAQHWWNRLSTSGDKNHLRDGSAIICSNNNRARQLTANGNNCLVLRINTPTTAYEIAS